MNLAIIQARMSSTRLPGKVLRKINDKTLLEILLQRISKSKLLNEIIVVTSTEKEDNEIENFCKIHSVKFFRGSEQDVLDRFYQATHQTSNIKHQISNIVRITADCPLHSAEVIDFVIQEFEKQKVDYFSNSNYPPDVLMDGCDTEVFTFVALEDAWKNAKLLSQREHVTPYIKDCGKFRLAYKKFNPEYNYKLSVDSPDDFKLVSEIFRYFYPNEFFTIGEVVELLKKKPELLEINKKSVINEGYQKSLASDKYIK